MLNFTSFLTERECTRIIKSWNKHCDYYRLLANTKASPSDTVELGDLITYVEDCEYNQIYYPNKVKDILLKCQTGLVNTGFYLLEPIVLGKVINSDAEPIVVGGRHRVAALRALRDMLLDSDYRISDYQVPVTVRYYPSLELLGKAIEASNNTRVMTQTEKERIRISVEKGGRVPTARTIVLLKNVSTTKRYFKQIMLSTILEANEEAGNSYKDILTEHNIGQLMGRFFDWYTKYNDPEGEVLKLLQQGDTDTWEAFNNMMFLSFEAGLFNQPKSGNISRHLAERTEELVEYCSELMREVDESTEENEEPVNTDSTSEE